MAGKENSFIQRSLFDLLEEEQEKQNDARSNTEENARRVGTDGERLEEKSRLKGNVTNDREGMGVQSTTIYNDNKEREIQTRMYRSDKENTIAKSSYHNIDVSRGGDINGSQSIFTTDSSRMVHNVSTDVSDSRERGDNISGTSASNENGRRNIQEEGSTRTDEKWNSSNGDNADVFDREIPLFRDDRLSRGESEKEFVGENNARGARREGEGNERGFGEVLEKSGEKTDYVSSNEIIIKNITDKYIKNISAIKLLKTLEYSNRYAMKNEQEILARYSGWGGLSQVFDESNKKGEKGNIELKALLTEDEYVKARATTLDSFYTPSLIIDSIYTALNSFGINNSQDKKEILEPSSGVGAFLSRNKINNSSFTCIELDSISSRILNFLHPSAKIYNNAFEKTNLESRFDCVIGNPPYGKSKVFDLEYSDLSGMNIHNYFTSKGSKLLKDDGIIAFVVTSSFLDSRNSSARERLSEEATFLGAFRLPNTAFKNAGTNVMSDIVFFQKGHKNKHLESKEWINSYNLLEYPSKDIVTKGVLSDRDLENLYINEYFRKNSSHILGELSVGTNQFGKIIECNDINKFSKDYIEGIIKYDLPKNVYKFNEYIGQKPLNIVKQITFEELMDNSYLGDLRVNSWFLLNNEVCVKKNDNVTFEYEIVDFSSSPNDKLRAIEMLKIKKHLKELLFLEKQDISDDNPQLIKKREELNTSYNVLVKKFSFLNTDKNKKVLQEDIEREKVLSLEKNFNKGISAQSAKKHGVEPQSPNAIKSDIFFKRTIYPTAIPTPTNAKEALELSLNIKGKIDLDYMRKILINKSKDEITKELLENREMFKNHKKDEMEEYIISSLYLSGNVKQKLDEVKELVKEDSSLLGNLQALNELIPQDLKASEISVSIGANWIPTEYYKQFFATKFDTNLKNINIEFDNDLGKWEVYINDRDISYSVQNEYSTSRANINRILKALMENNSISIYDSQEYYDSLEQKTKIKRILNNDETILANQKVHLLKNDFNMWIWDDYARRSHLERIYNDIFNTHIETNWKNSNIYLVNFNQAITLHPHQKNAIRRSLFQKDILLDHQVGAGKTFTACCSVMEQKRIGLSNKPLIVVPNHLIQQWKDSFMYCYNNANILVATKQDLKKEARERFFAKIATNDFDAIIMTHSQFKLLPTPQSIQRDLLEKEIAIQVKTIKKLNADNTSKNKRNYSVKRNEERLKTIRAKLEKLNQEEIKSKAIDFGDLGIDSLVIDEAHEFKNLFIATSMERVGGLGNLNGSQKAFDLYCKTQYMHQNNKKIMFLTGTPISNSITELYTIQRYLQPQLLKEKNLMHFDSWANTFGQISQDWELDSSGVNYKIVSRFSKFQNVPELMNYYKNVADIITNKDILKYNEHYIPKLLNDKPINVVVPRSELIANYIGVQDENGLYNENSIIWRMENFRKNPRLNNVLACTTDARKAGLDYRLIDPNAPDSEISKINSLVDDVFQTYQDWNEEKGTQLIFCDMSTPKIHSQQDSNFNTSILKENEEQNDEDNDFNLSSDEILAKNAKFDVYNDVLMKLMNKGIPRNEIRFIHDANTDLQKAQLFNDVNTGKVRILMGSTSKMGAGTNVQKRIVAINHLDCPWRPSDLEQRNGRAIRQGNILHQKDPLNFRIIERRYATKQTYDSRMWQTQEIKAKSNEEFRKGGKERVIDDFLSNDSDNAGLMKAEASGNPLILLQMQLKEALTKEEMTYDAFIKAKHYSEDRVEHLEFAISSASQNIKDLQQVINSRDNYNKEHNKEYFEVKLSNGDEIIIKKDDEVQDKELQNKKLRKFFEEEILKISYSNENIDKKILDYNGFEIHMTKKANGNNPFLGQLTEFSLCIGDIVYTPDNLIYKDITEFNIQGFFTKINNTLKNLEITIEKEKANLIKNQNELDSIKNKGVKEYENIAYLMALKEDNQTILEEINQSSKVKNYKSNFTPKSSKINKTEINTLEIDETKEIIRTELKQESDENKDYVSKTTINNAELVATQVISNQEELKKEIQEETIDRRQVKDYQLVRELMLDFKKFGGIVKKSEIGENSFILQCPQIKNLTSKLEVITSYMSNNDFKFNTKLIKCSNGGLVMLIATDSIKNTNAIIAQLEAPRIIRQQVNSSQSLKKEAYRSL